jgi:PleD family two-component response regulator
MQKKILIIDDDAAICDVLTEAYSSDYLVKTSSSPQNIFVLLNEFQPDVLLIEYKLEKNNGARLCSSIKLNPNTTNIPVIILSTIPQPNKEIDNCYCDNFVEKPFDLWSLHDTIEKYCAY